MLYALPDDLLLLCVDGSLLCAVKLARTNKVLRAKLQDASALRASRASL